MQFTALTFEISTRSATGAEELAFEPKRPIRFRAGQGGLFFVPGGGAKPFTFAGDDRSDRLSIATTLGSGIRFKRATGGAAVRRSGARHRADRHQGGARSRNAEHHGHRAGLWEAIDRAIVDRTTARWSVSGRSDFVAAVAARLSDAGIPARRIHRDAF